ncbi:RPAP1 family protein [Abortiporus biennis]
MSTSLVGSIVERKTSASSSSSVPKPASSNVTGFPAAQHRSLSAFARARTEQKTNRQERPQKAPTIQALGSIVREDVAERGKDDWRKQMEAENKRKVESMTEEEREQERQEILARFGPGIADVMKKIKAAREGGVPENISSTDLPNSIITSPMSPTSPSRGKQPRKGALVSRPSSPPLSTSSTRPPSRTDRHIRFAEVTPQDVFVYPSAPPSPKRQPLALPSPSQSDGPTISLGEWKGKGKDHLLQQNDTDSIPKPVEDVRMNDESLQIGEGTPEDIRRRFFPSAIPNNPSLEWIEGDSGPTDGPSNNTLRFDLQGVPIPPSLSETLPTHLGLHHHAEGSHAGYTLDDIFLLSRSTVPAQRASMLDVLGRIARRLAAGLKDPGQVISELKGQEAVLRKRIVAAGVEAMAERGSLGARAIEVMWVCIVGWDDDQLLLEGAELKDSVDAIISSIPLEHILPQISQAFAAAALPQESLSQLLAIVHRLAQHSNKVAETIVKTQGLIINLTQLFLLTPFPPSDGSPLPEPLAIQVITTLATASRSNALELLGPADALLRFVVTLPPSSPLPLPLAVSLLTSTLRLYTVLASYGLYSQIATTAQDHFRQTGAYIQSSACSFSHLRVTWLNLLEAWTVCAIDPHQTTPDHDILWSQVVGWGWGQDILEFRKRLSAEDSDVWAALWRAEAAWLEGASLNGIKGGEIEKAETLKTIRSDFESGTAHTAFEIAARGFRTSLDAMDAGSSTALHELAKYANVVAAAIRLWLACLPSHSQTPLESPPFSLPFPAISTLCARLTTHSLWSRLTSSDAPVDLHIIYRPLSQLLAVYLSMSRALPRVSNDLWIAQALSIILCMVPGDEETASRIVNELTNTVTREFMDSHSWQLPAVIWEKGGMHSIKPFLTYSLLSGESCIGPLWMTPHSAKASTTQRLPPISSIRENKTTSSLPLHRAWVFTPLDHLLRSGDSAVFKSLPSSWDYSETELIRATLVFARVAQEVLRIHGLQHFTMSREETEFECMKVFMLEHGQHESKTEEVFRDSVVSESMANLLAPFTLSASSKSLDLPPPVPNTEGTLELVARRFLGPSVPFYQYYTDFVNLYDSISFSHPLFARLLLPPISMAYPVDYRKFFWVDYGHIVRTVKTPVSDVLSGSIAEYLWPLESNPDNIAAMMRALVNGKGQLEGFLRFVVIHHLASLIWKDLRGNEDVGDEERSRKLLQAVVGQGDIAFIWEIVLYRQVQTGQVLLPPACFEQPKEGWVEGRRAFVQTCGEFVKSRLEDLL